MPANGRRDLICRLKVKHVLRSEEFMNRKQTKLVHLEWNIYLASPSDSSLLEDTSKSNWNREVRTSGKIHVS